jgi:tripeptidyl-peptidase-1
MAFSIGDEHLGEQLGAPGARRFSPLFPASCPFVTAVGATQVNPNSMYEPESTCEQPAFNAYSGGGFSNVFPMPYYQEEAVGEYLKQHPPPYTAEQYNNSGRVKISPSDINRVLSHAEAITRPAHTQICLLTGQYYFMIIPFSALLIRSYSANFVIIRNGNSSLAFGTSASVQVVGAIVTLINDARLAHGKSTIGESWLYIYSRVAGHSYSWLQGFSILWYVNAFHSVDCVVISVQIYYPLFSHAFNDITKGSNPGCGESL